MLTWMDSSAVKEAAEVSSLAVNNGMSRLRRNAVAAMVAWAMLAVASASLCDEDTESAVSDEIDADTVESRAVTNFDEFKAEEGVTLARFTTLSINARAAYAAILGLNTAFRAIPMGIGTPTEGNVAGINLETMGIILDNPTNATSPPKERYAVSSDNVVKLIQPGAFADQLTEILRQGARALLAQAVEAEVADFLAQLCGIVPIDQAGGV
jgi:hypothetical protein